MILATLFQDGAVLQRDMRIPVWGSTTADTVVFAKLDNSEACTRSAADGKFMLYLPAHDAGGPFELTVSAPETGEKVTVKNVLVGEVWLASGQSNMEYMLGSDYRVQIDGEELEKDDSEITSRKQQKLFNEMVMDSNNFRFFTVEKYASGVSENTCSGSWKNMDADNSEYASAVAAWFGLGLQYQLDVPVGIIISAWGGTVAEAWTSFNALCANTETQKMADDLMILNEHMKIWSCPAATASGVQFEYMPGVEKDSGNTGFDQGFAAVDFDDSSWQSMVIAGSWIKQHISGNGAIWVRKTVDIPDSWANQPLILQGGCVDKHDTSYFNGVEIGQSGRDFDTMFYNKKRRYPIDGNLVHPGKAVVAIRAFSFALDGAISGQWSLVNTVSGESINLNGQWQAHAEYDRGIVDITESALSYAPGNPNTPAILYESMIRPLVPYALRGVIWYQGESNAKSLARSRQYRDLLQIMIDDWRYNFRQSRLPFIMVQLAGYGKKESFYAGSLWAELRESQRLIAQNDPDSFIASAIDIGEEEDIHPQNKFDVGKRLAMCALHHVYNCLDAIPSGPEIIKAEASGNSVTIRFKYADELKLKSDEASFFVCGNDGVFTAVDHVEVKDDTLILTSGKVRDITEVKYAWADFPIPVLFNHAGLPASSFHIVLNEDKL